ncbi:translocation and assembly module TamA [Azospirillaceae bacterium]
MNRRLCFRACVASFFVVIPCRCACADAVDGAPDVALEAPVEQTAAYHVFFDDFEDEGDDFDIPDEETLRDLLETASSLFQLKDRPPPSLLGLRRRADGDQERLQTALRSVGFYEGSVAIDISSTKNDPKNERRGASVEASEVPFRVKIHVRPGRIYHFGVIAVVELSGAPVAEALRVSEANLGFASGQVALASKVVEARQRLLTHLQRQGYARARVAESKAEIDRDAHALDVTFQVDSGVLVRFGRTLFEGLEQIDESLARGRVSWRSGDVYHPEKLDQARTALNALGVFASIRFQLAEAPDADGLTAVTIVVTERKRRFVGAGVHFATNEGLGGQVYWGHRNLFGGGEQLRFGAEVGRLTARTVQKADEQNPDMRVTGELRKPDFGAIDQSLILSSSAIVEKPVAYQRNSLMTGVRLERWIDKKLIVGGGLTAEHQRIREKTRTTVGAVMGAPLTVTYDNSDSLLDPRRGFRLAISTAPYLQAGDAGGTFWVSRATQTVYQDLCGDGRWIAAGRLSLGAIADDKSGAVPADKRFYAGGGGSVRGFAHQKVGPLAVDGTPVGGLSLAELGAEVRIKVSDALGVVPFVDGGNVFSSVLPDFSRPLRFGAGVGVRYYTDFGPLRMDVGTPLDRRSKEDYWQLYLSLGQAF